MAGLVLDASVVLASVLPGEVRAEPTHGLMADATRRGALVPALWPPEVGNALLMHPRRGRLAEDQLRRILRQLTALTLEIDATDRTSAWEDALARRHRLTLHDAAYLELALRKSLPLASFDQELREAATRESLPLLDLPT